MTMMSAACEVAGDGFILPLGVPAATSDRVGPKAASLASLARAGLPTPGGFCLTARAYHAQIEALGLADMVQAYDTADMPLSRRLSIDIRIALYEQPIADPILEPLLACWRDLRASSALVVVRSSALVEDRKGANFAGQFESFLGIADEDEFLVAVRACWAALWTSNARRYMDGHGLSPSSTAMAVLIQPLVQAIASGGGLSETAEGHMLISATWGSARRSPRARSFLTASCSPDRASSARSRRDARITANVARMAAGSWPARWRRSLLASLAWSRARRRRSVA